jgi:hypothetical protein
MRARRIKSEGKAFEEMLEDESARKEGEIRKLREEAILKEKTFKATKAEFAQLQSENTSLKVLLSPHRSSSAASAAPAKEQTPSSCSARRRTAHP